MDTLKPQARQVLYHLILRRGLTARSAMEMSPPCFRLAARVKEIREVFGEAAVETTYVTHNGGRHALYRWRGPDSIQLEMDAA
jgi:hypothetical protein